MTDANHNGDVDPGSVDPGDVDGGASELISRLRIIEGQPLSDRAGAYTAVHDELARRLESGPGDRHLGG